MCVTDLGTKKKTEISPYQNAYYELILQALQKNIKISWK